MKGKSSNRMFNAALTFSLVLVVGLAVAAGAGAATITTWIGGKASTPQLITAGGGACPGTVIMITGSGFVSDGGPVSVSIGGTPASEVIVGSDQYLYARVGAGTKSGSVVVTTKAGAVTASSSAIVLPCQASGTAATKPVIDAATPQQVKGGKKVKLQGSGFVGTSGVTVNGAATAYAIPSDGVLYVIMPASAKAGLATIVVTNSLGSAKVVVQKVG